MRRFLLISASVVLAGLLGFQAGRSSGGASGEASGERVAGPPLIGIASLSDENYVRAVREAGGIPVVLPTGGDSEDRIDGYLERLDGLLLPGGADIPPSEYGEEPHPTVEVLDERRFRFERALSRAWIERTDKPLLGICLGCQWINVASGGSLVQDIPSEFGVQHRGRSHRVSIDPASRLGRIIGAAEIEVNSSHHQAPKKLGRDLRVVARCPDGVVEAIESSDGGRFLLGVQWHPERMQEDDGKQRKLLRAFVAAAAE